MTGSPSLLQGKSTAAAAPIHQVYLTHCIQTDSRRNEAGFSIRGSSTDDEALLKFALDYPGLELPLDMLAGDPEPERAPRRLAMVETPDGRPALIHSAYLRRDTRGRPGNYFTHVLFPEHLTLTAALETWGSPAWRVKDEKEDRELDRFEGGLPAPPALGKLDPEALKRFLGDAAPPSPAELALAICPQRLLKDRGARLELLRMALTAALLLDERADAGAQLRILGEPGLCALLLYGVARLIPGEQVQALTFSTYEPLHRSFRYFRAARVVCTYTADPGTGLPGEAAQELLLDTFQPARSSPRLREQAEPAVAELLALAAQGEWEAVAALHRYRPPGPVSGDVLRAGGKRLELAKS